MSEYWPNNYKSQSGCAVAVCSMILQAMGAKNWTPAWIYEQNGNSVFMQWNQMGYSTFHVTENPNASIELVNLVFGQIFHPNLYSFVAAWYNTAQGGVHWVMIIGYGLESMYDPYFIVVDPAIDSGPYKKSVSDFGGGYQFRKFNPVNIYNV